MFYQKSKKKIFEITSDNNNRNEIRAWIQACDRKNVVELRLEIVWKWKRRLHRATVTSDTNQQVGNYRKYTFESNIYIRINRKKNLFISRYFLHFFLILLSLVNFPFTCPTFPSLILNINDLSTFKRSRFVRRCSKYNEYLYIVRI